MRILGLGIIRTLILNNKKIQTNKIIQKDSAKLVIDIDALTLCY